MVTIDTLGLVGSALTTSGNTPLKNISGHSLHNWSKNASFSIYLCVSQHPDFFEGLKISQNQCQHVSACKGALEQRISAITRAASEVEPDP